MEPVIRLSIEIDAPIEEVWHAWATQEGALTFFAPECKVDTRPGGTYEMYFNLEASEGSRGGEGLVILAMQEPTMLSFTWNAPPELAEVREQHTHVTLRLTEIDEKHTLVNFHEDGFGSGGQWDERVKYFQHAWGKVILPRLAYRFKHGPVDWNQRPDLDIYHHLVKEG